MLSFTTGAMDKLKQPLPPDDPVDLAANLQPRLGSFGGSIGGTHGGSFPMGRNLTSLRNRTSCAPQIWSSSYGQDSYHARQEDLEADWEIEDESTARMQSLVPSGLLQDDGRDYQDSLSMFPSEMELPRGTNVDGETESSHQEFLWRVYGPRSGKNGSVGARRDQRFDSDFVSCEEGFAGRHLPTPAGGYVDPNLARGYVDPNLARGYVDPNLARGYVDPNLTGGYVDRNLAAGYDPDLPRGYVDRNLAGAYYPNLAGGYVDPNRAGGNFSTPAAVSEAIRIASASALANLNYFSGSQTTGTGTVIPQMMNDFPELFRSSTVLSNEVLAGLLNPTHQQGHPTSDGEFEKARNEIFEFEQLRTVVAFLILDARRQAISELSERNDFSSPQPTTVAAAISSPAATATSNNSTPANVHPAALRHQSHDPREKTSCGRSRSLRNTPEKKPDGYPSNSYSTPRRKSTSSSTPVTKALIAQGTKSISVILRPERSGSKGGSSHPASPSSPGSTPVSPAGSGSLSPIRPRRLSMSNTDALQLIPMENASVELNVFNQGQVKTELCNNWQESGWCRYGERCRFAHGVKELRCVLRHHRYKSVPCRMIMEGKECIYGHRCHYRHSLTEQELSLVSVAKLIPRKSS